MDKAALDRYKRLLETKLEELKQTVFRRDAIAVERSPDILDDLQSVVERERVITEIDRSSRLLQEVKAALSRIETGDYGFCQRCEEPISPARLNAVPWTPFCIHCQEAEDARRSAESRPAFHELLMAA
jgi:DnaK suppressor protein